METIKTAQLGLQPVKYPQGITTLEEFIQYLNDACDTFVKLEVYNEDDCVAPFYIDGKTKTIYINLHCVRHITEETIHILSKDEYDARLKEVIAQKCVHCVHYCADVCKEDFDSHRNHINLNGECYSFEKKDV